MSSDSGSVPDPKMNDCKNNEETKTQAENCNNFFTAIPQAAVKTEGAAVFKKYIHFPLHTLCSLRSIPSERRTHCFIYFRLWYCHTYVHCYALVKNHHRTYMRGMVNFVPLLKMAQKSNNFQLISQHLN